MGLMTSSLAAPPADKQLSETFAQAFSPYQRPGRVRSFDEYAPTEVRQLPMIGKIPFTAYSGDNRFSVCLYIPYSYTAPGSLRVVVLVHSSDRDAAELRNAFADFAEAHRCVVLAPLFPQGLIDPDEPDNYKKLEYKGIRFDLVLIGILEELHQRWPKADTSRVFMQGFSGGAQFVHRFAFLHPERLEAIVIAAPGSVTSLDAGADYPEGVGNVERLFGVKWNPEALRHVRVLLLVGSLDDGIEHLVARRVAPGKCRNRIQTLTDFQNSLNVFGLCTKLNIVAGAGHEAEKMYQDTKEFFSEALGNL